MNTDTPETDAEILQILMDRGVVDHRNAPENLVNKCRGLERERNHYKRTLEEMARGKLHADTQRLDWLQSHRKTVWKASHEEWGISTADPFIRAKIEVFDGWVVDPNDEPKRLIRDAIDAAMFLPNTTAQATTPAPTNDDYGNKQ